MFDPQNTTYGSFALKGAPLTILVKHLLRINLLKKNSLIIKKKKNTRFVRLPSFL